MFEPPDSFHFSAAIGWLGLDNHSEAKAELEKMAPELQLQAPVWAVRREIYAAEKNWLEAEAASRILVELIPTQAGHWLNLAYATRRKPNGSIDEAKTILEKAATIFPGYCMIFFNLACYESQLGHLEKAKNWLDKAYKVGDPQQLQQMVLDDPDLEPLRKEFKIQPKRDLPTPSASTGSKNL